MRNHADLVSAIIAAMPSHAELAALTDEQLADLRKIGNSYDNVLYLEVLQRSKPSAG